MRSDFMVSAPGNTAAGKKVVDTLSFTGPPLAGPIARDCDYPDDKVSSKQIPPLRSRRAIQRKEIENLWEG